MMNSFNISGKYDALADFRDYKERGVKLFSIEKLKNGVNYHLNFYDINGDKIYDIVELIPVSGADSALKPLIYFFDVNNNSKIDDGEAIVDPLMDGLNGNERLADFGNLFDEDFLYLK